MGFAAAANKVGSPIVKVGSKRHNEYLTGTGEFAGNYQGTGKPAPTGNTKLYGQRTGSTVSSASVTPTVRTEPRTIDDVNTVPRNIMDWKPLK